MVSNIVNIESITFTIICLFSLHVFGNFLFFQFLEIFYFFYLLKDYNREIANNFVTKLAFLKKQNLNKLWLQTQIKINKS